VLRDRIERPTEIGRCCGMGMDVGEKKLREMKWVGHIARMGERRVVCRVLVE
jgi:hypothetical protein